MQKTTLIGNLGGDAVQRTTDSGAIAISFNVAVSERRKDQEYTTWYSCTMWRNPDQSTAVAQYLKKGKKVYVEGKPSVRAFTDKNGQNGASLDVRVDYVELLGDSQPAQPQQAAPQQYQQPAPQQHVPQQFQQPAQSFPPPVSDDDLPF